MADARQYNSKRNNLACEMEMIATKNPSILVDIRCKCGQKIGEVFGFFRLKCSNKPMHEKQMPEIGKQNVIVEGYTHEGQAVIEGIWPEMIP